MHMQAMTRRLAAIGVVSILVLSGCASGPRIVTNSAPDFNISDYRTFSYLSPLSSDRGNVRSILSTHLMDATTRELEAIVLKYRHQLPQTEIARHLRVGAPRVTRLLQSATKRLREALESRFELRAHDRSANTELFRTVERMLARTDAEMGRRAPGKRA